MVAGNVRCVFLLRPISTLSKGRGTTGCRVLQACLTYTLREGVWRGSCWAAMVLVRAKVYRATCVDYVGLLSVQDAVVEVGAELGRGEVWEVDGRLINRKQVHDLDLEVGHVEV